MDGKISSKLLIAVVSSLGLFIVIFTIHSPCAQDQIAMLLPAMRMISADSDKKLSAFVNKEVQGVRHVSFAIAPFVYPQLYRCPMDQAKQPKNDEHMSQAHEDEWLFNHVFSKLPFEQRFGGTFIEIGALNGKRYSNTWYFEKKWDWRGILIEGHPSNSPKLREIQSTRKNCAIFTAAVCELSSEGDPGILRFTRRGGETGAALADASPKFIQKWHNGNADGKVYIKNYNVR